MNFIRDNWIRLLSLMCLICAAGWWVWLQTGARPPMPADMSHMDPMTRMYLTSALEAVQRNRRDAEMWLQLAQAYHANEQAELAKQCYEQTISIDPSEGRAWYGIALVEDHLGNVDGAFRAIGQVVDAEECYVPALWKRIVWRLDAGDVEGAAADVERAMAIAPVDGGTTVCRAMLLLEQDDPAGAAALLKPHVMTFPEDEWVHRILGQAYRRLGRTEDAMLAAARGGARKMRFDDPWFNQIDSRKRDVASMIQGAKVAMDLGQRQNAIRVMKDLLQQVPGNATVIHNLVVMYGDTEQVGEGLSLLDSIDVSAYSASDQAKIAMAKSYMLSLNGRPAEALAAADEAIAHGPDIGLAYYRRGEALGDLFRTEEAIEAYAEAGRILSENGQVLVRKGQLEGSLGRMEDAAMSFRMATERDPVYLPGWIALCSTEALLGNDEAALEALRMLRRIAPNDPRVAAVEAGLIRDGVLTPDHDAPSATENSGS